jgi:hypothetical protein
MMMMTSIQLERTLERVSAIEQRLGLNTPPEITPYANKAITAKANALLGQSDEAEATITNPLTDLNGSIQNHPMDFASLLNPQLPEANPANTQRGNVLGTTVEPFTQGLSTQRSALQPLVQTYAKANGVAPSLVEAVIRAESGYNHQAISKTGAQGLMQLMPATAKSLGVNNAFNPEENIKGGSQYLGQLLKRFNGNKALAVAAYNAGPGAVEKHGGIPPYRETQQYVKRVLGYEAQLQ